MLFDKLNRLLRPLLTFGALFALASTAQAMCVYNDMDVEVPVEFQCGFLCTNEWNVDAGGSQCRPGTSGRVLVPSVGPVEVDGVIASIDVDAHGYVVFYGTGGAGSTRQICAYHSDDSLDHCNSFTYPTASTRSLRQWVGNKRHLTPG